MAGSAPWTRRGVTAAAAASLAGCVTGQGPANRRRELTVATLNIWHDQGDWPKRLPVILAALRRLRPDVLALQEVLEDAGKGLPNQARTIADALGMSADFVSPDPEGAPRRYGNAILSRWPSKIQDWTRLEPMDDYRTAASSFLTTPSGWVNVYCTHLHHTEAGAAIRSRQVAGLMEFIYQTGIVTAWSLLMGDFNACPDAPELAALKSRFTDVFAAANPGDTQTRTFRAGPPGYRIDQIYVETGQFEVISAGLFLDRPGADGVFGSDHVGVTAKVRVLR